MGLMSFLMGLAACLMLPADSAPVEPALSGEAALVRGGNAFGLDLYAALAEQSPEGNLFLSPYSISSALAIAWAGAEGETASQMAEVLGLDLPSDSVYAFLAGIREKLSPDYRRMLVEGPGDPLTLETANALWLEDTYALLPPYVDLAREAFAAEVRNMDFVGDAEGSRVAINDWVAEVTRDRILDLLVPGSVNASTRLVITNAVYFKGSWADAFQEADTWDEPFHLAGGDSVEVPMMHRTDTYRYGTAHGCRAIELPYADYGSSMLILLPDGDLAAFERDLTVERLEAIRDGLWRTRVALSMPRFEFTRSMGLADVLAGMGMTDAFQAARADFSGMTGSPDLCISEVVHQAFVKVDEEGTEAAAATAVVMVPTCIPAPEPDPVPLVLDRPFVFLIRDEITGTLLFMGRMADPS